MTVEHIIITDFENIFGKNFNSRKLDIILQPKSLVIIQNNRTLWKSIAKRKFL